MNSFRKNVEWAADVGIAVVALLLCFILARNQFFSSPASNACHDRQASGEKSLVGAKINLPQANWQKNGKTVLLALSTTCHFCIDSTPFYKRLTREKDGVRVVAVMPQTVDVSKKYLDANGVAVDEVAQSALDSIGVEGTPTIMLVDDFGVVTHRWVGRLNAGQEMDVLAQIQSARQVK